MTYKKALYFIGECLTLTQFPERRKGIINQIKEGHINWKIIVKVSSGHMVLPAFYLNLKRADVLRFLPQDLVTYCEEITKQNRDRNTAIIEQVTQLNSLLSPHNISPVFLKGTAHLLEDLYEDIGERMVGDIDFLVAPHQVEQVANILIKSDYKSIDIYHKKEQKLSKHYPRMIHNNWITAVEIHRTIIQPPYKNDLGYHTIFENKLQIDNFFAPSYPHQAEYNILNVQINDSGFLYGKIMIRQMYDGYLLSFKPNVVGSHEDNKSYFYRKTTYLQLIQQLFKTEHLNFEKSFLTRCLMLQYDLSINYPKIRRFLNAIIYYSLRLYSYPKQLIQAFYKKEVRISLLRKLRDPNWYRRHIKSYRKQS